MPIPMQLYQSTGIDFCHRIYWLRSVVDSKVKSKWKWSTSWQSDDYPHVHVRLVNRWTSMSLLCLCCCKCACWVFDVAFGRCSKCMNTKWWSQCMAAENQPKRGISWSIGHPFWVLYTKMSLRPGPMFPTHPTTVESLLKMQRTTRKTIASQWCAADKCARTNDDERLECIWRRKKKSDEHLLFEVYKC